MKATRTGQWFRTVALGCAMAAGTTAFGDYYKVWTAEGKAYWDGESSWTASNEGTVLDDYRVTQAAAQIAFDKAVTDNAANFYVYGGSATLSADESSFGLTKDNWFCVGVWFGGSAAATIESGTYSFAEVNVGRWASGTLTLAGGSVTTPNIYVGTDEVTGTITIDDGATVSTGQIAGGSQGSLEVNGGTFANDTDATISVAVTGSGTLTKTGAGTLAFTGDISGFTGSISVAEGAGSVTVGETVIGAGETKSFEPDMTYYWSGAAKDDNLWSNVNNWLVSGKAPTAPPAADSVVVIPEGEGELTVKVGSGTYTGNLTINRNVKMQYVNSNEGITLSSVSGDGYTLTLEGGGSKYFNLSSAGDFTVNCNLKIVNWVRNTSGSVLKVYGSFSGNGKFNNQTNKDQPGVEFYGDTSGFTGIYEGGLRNNGNRDGTRFYGSARGSATGAWSFGGADDYKRCALRVSGTTYYFGSLNTIHDGNNRFNTFIDSKTRLANATLQIGGRANSTSNFGGTLDGTNNKIVKVGDTSTLNVTLTETAGAIEAKEGTTVLKGSIAPATLTVTGTGATVKIANTVGTYENNVQTAGFLPVLGSTLASYRFDTSSETIDNVEYTVYVVVPVVVPGTPAAFDTEAAANAASVVLTTEQTNQGLDVGYYKKVVTLNTDTGKYDVTAVLDEEAVKPTVEGEENKGAMEVSTDNVSLNVTNTKKGLYYGIAAGTDTNLDMEDVAADSLILCENDGDDLNLTADMPDSGVKYYKVVVSDVQK